MDDSNNFIQFDRIDTSNMNHYISLSMWNIVTKSLATLFPHNFQSLGRARFEIKIISNTFNSLLSSSSHYFYWIFTPVIGYSYQLLILTPVNSYSSNCFVTNYWFLTPVIWYSLSLGWLILLTLLHWLRHPKRAKIWWQNLDKWARKPSYTTTYTYVTSVHLYASEIWGWHKSVM